MLVRTSLSACPVAVFALLECMYGWLCVCVCVCVRARTCCHAWWLARVACFVFACDWRCPCARVSDRSCACCVCVCVCWCVDCGARAFGGWVVGDVLCGCSCVCVCLSVRLCLCLSVCMLACFLTCSLVCVCVCVCVCLLGCIYASMHRCRCIHVTVHLRICNAGRPKVYEA